MSLSLFIFTSTKLVFNKTSIHLTNSISFFDNHSIYHPNFCLRQWNAFHLLSEHNIRNFSIVNIKSPPINIHSSMRMKCYATIRVYINPRISFIIQIESKESSDEKSHLPIYFDSRLNNKGGPTLLF